MIVVILLTYDREEYAIRTLEAMARNLRAPEPMWLHIADDGSSQDYRDRLFERAHKVAEDRCSISNSERGGYGASYNLATQATHRLKDEHGPPLILPLEDDWELSKEFDLTPMVEMLRRDERGYGCIRMGYVGFTQELKATFVFGAGLKWLHLDPDSAEPHVWAGHPRLETLAYQRKVGPWPTGLNAGATEFEVAKRRVARQGVLWPVDLIHPRGDLFSHIGTVQAREDQRVKS